MYSKSIHESKKWWNGLTPAERNLYTRMVYGEKTSYKGLNNHQILHIHKENGRHKKNVKAQLS